MADYYDGTKLLSMKDINGDTPEIFICTTNRTAGKTTYFNRLMINRFIKKQQKFCTLVRYQKNLAGYVPAFFDEIHRLFFPDYFMNMKQFDGGIYGILYLSKDPEDIGVPCGYVVAINAADDIKKYSHMLADSSCILFDEFQPMSASKYCPDEILKFQSIHTSIARGAGKQYRYLPTYMLANNISLLNPYYVQLGISNTLTNRTKFMRGEGFVIEQGFNESAYQAQAQSAFNRAFRGAKTEYGEQGIYLNDDLAFIEKPNGRNRYVVTLRYKNKDYAVREYYEQGVVYCDDKPDMSHPLKISVTIDDHNINYVMLRQNPILIGNLRYLFERGCFRFKNLQCKEVILTTLSY